MFEAATLFSIIINRGVSENYIFSLAFGTRTPLNPSYMASKKEILGKIRILITQKFKDPNEAFNFFDKNGDGYLEYDEIKKLIKKAKVNRFLAPVVANKIIRGLDKNKNKKLNWKEFSKATKVLLSE